MSMLGKRRKMTYSLGIGGTRRSRRKSTASFAVVCVPNIFGICHDSQQLKACKFIKNAARQRRQPIAVEQAVETERLL